MQRKRAVIIQITFSFVILMSVFIPSSSYAVFSTAERQLREKSLESQEFLFMGYYPALLEQEMGPGPKFEFGFEQLYRSEEPQRIWSTGSSNHPVSQHLSDWGEQGLPLSAGYNFWETYSFRYQHENRFALSSQLRAGVSSRDDSWAQWQRLVAEVRFRSLIFSVGRQPLYWGQSFVSPILIGDNAQSLDQIKLSTLPISVFSWNQWRAEFFVSRMGEDRSPSHEYLWGWRLGSLWWERFELNIAALYQLKGEGARGGSFKSYLLEFFGTRSAKPENDEAQAGGNSDVTNRSIALDFRLRFDDLALPFQFYSEQHLEDCCGSLSTIYNKSYNYTYGVYFPFEKEFSMGDWSFEFTRTATALYYHHRWPASVSNRGQILGHPLGPDSIGFYNQWKKSDFRFYFFFEKRRRTGRISESLSITGRYPDYQNAESRWTWGSAWKPELSQGLYLDTGLWLQWVESKNYKSENQWEWMSSLGVKAEF